MQTTKFCSFFAHRDARETIAENLYQAIVKTIVEDDVSIFYADNNGAFDRLARLSVIRAKKDFPHIKIYLVFAYLPTIKDTFLEEKYDGTVYPEGLESFPKRFAISHRNKGLVRQSDVVIGYVKTSYGGAYEALHYAKNQKKKVINLGG
ncbi:hypothetical protein LAD12857_28820 [Lacrimispora amygdalina]|uniref:Uncharacterized protein n=1 Tax=Lacrimispora amygdalina TaxID=253257 RepID=A0ABQ5M7N7_9FIRM